MDLRIQRHPPKKTHKTTRRKTRAQCLNQRLASFYGNAFIPQGSEQKLPIPTMPFATSITLARHEQLRRHRNSASAFSPSSPPGKFWAVVPPPRAMRNLTKTTSLPDSPIADRSDISRLCGDRRFSSRPLGPPTLHHVP